MMADQHTDKMVIITSYFKDETYGLLGPQMAATIIDDHSSYACIVIAVTRDYDKVALKNTLTDCFGAGRPLIGFSALSGRNDLFDLAGELKDEGAVTILAGPQADADFSGEQGWREYSHRFRGFSENFNFGLQGPAEQVVGLLDQLEGHDRPQVPGILYVDRDGNIIQNPSNGWNQKYLGKVKWDNIYLASQESVVPMKVKTGQVLEHIGCPHAARTIPVEIDYPAAISGRQGQRIRIPLNGCSFCDVAVDKGFYGRISRKTLISQIRCLPERADGRKIPLELINENPLPGLANLLQDVEQQDIRLSQVNLTLRADWLAAGIRQFREALAMAAENGIYILLSSIGFESFDDTLLRNLNKGLSVAKNLEVIRCIRQLKEEFPRHLGYAAREGANHGFIHPTPWDTKATAAENQKNIVLYGLQNDILPPHSTPLIIHHASGLGDWIRAIEIREGIAFKRYGSIIGWWDEPRRIQSV